MNRFRNYILMAAGFAVLALVVGIFSAGPAIAQAVRAALVSNVDDPGRIPYTVNQSFQDTDSCFAGCFAAGSDNVPPGKRLVITYVTGEVNTTAPGGTLIKMQIAKRLFDFTGAARIPIIFSGSSQGSNFFAFSQPVLLFYDPGTSPRASLLVPGSPVTNGLSVTMSGYLIDCTTAPCAAINP